MRQRLTTEEQKRLDQRVTVVEKRTGSQIVLAVIERSDSYAELPWKAFALGAAGAGLAVTVLDLLRPGWQSSTMVLIAVMATLLCGAACALACVSLPGFARLFLDAHRADAEARQFAESLFLSREIFATRSRTGILLMVSLFEREVVVLPDKGLSGRIGSEELDEVIGRMTAHLAAGHIAQALEAGLEGLEAVLGTSITAAGNELANDIIQEKGA